LPTHAPAARGSRAGWALYQVGLALTLGVAGPWMLLWKGRHYRATVRGRWGLDEPAEEKGVLWIHAVSVGEVAVAGTLARSLPNDLPLLITTITPTGQQRARETLGERARVAYLPFDLGPPVERFLRRFEPAALVLVEGDYWPLLLSRVVRRGLPVATVNGRVGDRSYARLRRMPALARWLLGPVNRFGVQSAEDGRRLVSLGVPEERVRVTGNLKYEAAPPEIRRELESSILAMAGQRPVLIAGSTMPGEEEEVLSAFREAGGGEAALLLVAPRHPERWDAVARTVAAGGLRLARRSDLPARGRPDVLLLDSLGELAGLYRLAAAVFIGGTLVGTGGHNPLEPARFGKAIVVGPSMENFRDMAAQLDREGAWLRAANGAQLGRAWRRLLARPEEASRLGEAARRLVEENRGALERTLELLDPVLLTLTKAQGPRTRTANSGPSRVR
jgi:3-deoxy-D-manno-octulosonic-acid transferase